MRRIGSHPLGFSHVAKDTARILLSILRMSGLRRVR
jgi:hypothetical protein